MTLHATGVWSRGPLNDAEVSLRALTAELLWLPEYAELWKDETEHNPAVFSLEWDDLMGRFEALVDAADAGLLSPVQAARFAELVRLWHDVLPMVERKGLWLPARLVQLAAAA